MKNDSIVFTLYTGDGNDGPDKQSKYILSYDILLF